MSDLAMYDVVEKEKKQYIVVKIGGEHYGSDFMNSSSFSALAQDFRQRYALEGGGGMIFRL